MTTRENEWQPVITKDNEWPQITMSDSEWQGKVKRKNTNESK